MPKLKVECANCEKIVERYPSQCLNTVYCSRKCRSDYFKRESNVTFNCDQCGKEKTVKKSNFEGRKNHFCSYACHNEWKEVGFSGENNPFHGKSHTEESRRKVSLTKKSQRLKGKRSALFKRVKVKCDQCEKVVWKIPYLAKRSKRQFCSNDCHYKWNSENLVGKNSPSWKPYLSDEDREPRRMTEGYYEFIRNVNEKYDYTCVVCGFRSTKRGIHVHHLNGYNWDKENRTNIKNAVTLCESCHRGFHDLYGYGDNTKEQFESYFNDTTKTPDL